jgi:hypothetical protein
MMVAGDLPEEKTAERAAEEAAEEAGGGVGMGGDRVLGFRKG